MIRKSDWQMARERILAEDRRRLGPPPTAEEVLAYSNGELSKEDEARVQELLVAYPDLARLLAEPEEVNDEPLSKEELDASWDALQQRIHSERTGAVAEVAGIRFWRRASAACAAALMLSFGGLLWQVQSTAALSKELANPRIVAKSTTLQPAGQRGPGSRSGVTIPADADLHHFALAGDWGFKVYRAEIVDGAGRTLWRSGSFPDRSPREIEILVPREFLTPGRYEIVLFGVDGNREEQLPSYPFRVQ